LAHEVAVDEDAQVAHDLFEGLVGEVPLVHALLLAHDLRDGRAAVLVNEYEAHGLGGCATRGKRRGDAHQGHALGLLVPRDDEALVGVRVDLEAQAGHVVLDAIEVVDDCGATHIERVGDLCQRDVLGRVDQKRRGNLLALVL